MVDSHVTHCDSGRGPVKGSVLLDELEAAMDSAFNDIISDGLPAGTSNSASAFYHNAAGNTGE
jgi:hypothetical protein